MSISGVLIGAAPGQQQAVRQAVEALPWAEVHHGDDKGRMIATVEGESTEEVIGRLKTLKALPGVVVAEMVVHSFEEEAEALEAPQPDAAVDYLNDDRAPIKASHYRRLKALGNY